MENLRLPLLGTTTKLEQLNTPSHLGGVEGPPLHRGLPKLVVERIPPRPVSCRLKGREELAVARHAERVEVAKVVPPALLAPLPHGVGT